MTNIRNFLICAHVDHGKSTLADRLLEITGTVEKRLMKPQYLDQLELERERGITIKMAPVRMVYRPAEILNSKRLGFGACDLGFSGSEYILNLIDTPGHSDFAYEVSRALAAVEGAILLVDTTQGIQAQTLANFENARKAGLTIVGAINKIDIATPEQIEDAVIDLAGLIGVDPKEILKVSGKTGEGVETLLQTIIEKVPPPSPMNTEPATNSLFADGVSRALVFDSLYDEHKGIIAFVRVFSAEGGPASGGSGSFFVNQTMHLIATDTTFKAKEIGYFAPQLRSCGRLRLGEIGYIATGIKDPDKLKIGDTVIGNYELGIKNYESVPGFQEPRPVVFVSFYPAESNQYDEFKQALAKLRLTDSSITLEPDSSEVLGRGFKGGFLGRLHFEIAAERLSRGEFSVKGGSASGGKISTVHSFPSVAYRVDDKIITNPKDFPNDYKVAEEPMAKIEIVTPPMYLGAVLQLKEVFRFSDLSTETLKNKVVIKATLPLADLIRDLDDKLKSVSQGFASFSYELSGYQKADVNKLEILVAGHLVPGLTRILPKTDIEREARFTVEKLKEFLPKQQFPQALQAMANGRIIARETIPATKKLLGYFGKTGGDRTRKMKLWKKQQKGKKKLQEMAEKSPIKIPAGVFKELLKK